MNTNVFVFYDHKKQKQNKHRIYFSKFEGKISIHEKTTF